MDDLAACPHCGLVQICPPPPPDHDRACARCAVRMPPPCDGAGLTRTAALALTALVLYVPAVLLPVLAISRFGHVNRAGILGGIADMLAHGQWLIGVLVLVCSVVIPLLKLSGLLAISLGNKRLNCHQRARTHRLIEWTGRWSMIDVLLVAVLVAVLKLGDLVKVEIGSGLYAFTACVVLSLAASASFDPRQAWSRT